MTPKPRDWDDVIRRRTAKNEKEYQSKIDRVMQVLGLEQKDCKRVGIDTDYYDDPIPRRKEQV